MLIARYRVELKEEPQFAHETFEQRKERILRCKPGITLTYVLALLFSGALSLISIALNFQSDQDPPGFREAYLNGPFTDFSLICIHLYDACAEIFMDGL